MQVPIRLRVLARALMLALVSMPAPLRAQILAQWPVLIRVLLLVLTWAEVRAPAWLLVLRVVREATRMVEDAERCGMLIRERVLTLAERVGEL